MPRRTVQGLKWIHTRLALDSGADVGAVVLCAPELVHGQDAPFLFLCNGFSANAKTWTFKPLLEDGSFGLSIAEYLALQGFVVVIKNIGSRRVKVEPSFSAHVAHVPEYARAVIGQVPRLIGGASGALVARPRGVHWIGHSLGGMVVMPAGDRSGLISFAAVASPTYMDTPEPVTKAVGFLLARVIGLHARQRLEPLPIEAIGRLSHLVMNALGIRGGRKLSYDQEFLVDLLFHLPGFRLVAHTFLNLDHLDRETCVAFFRSALANETVYLMIEFAQALMKGEKSRGEVLGRKIVPLDVPTLVVAGGGDNVAPPQSCEDLAAHVVHERRETVTFEDYDHLGLLVRNTALRDVWPVFTTFILENHLPADAHWRKTREFKRKIQRTISVFGAGPKAAAFADDAVRRMETRIDGLKRRDKKPAPDPP
ncbi:MAG: alpha/beta fold hydrolase [bacterium]